MGQCGLDHQPRTTPAEQQILDAVRPHRPALPHTGPLKLTVWFKRETAGTVDVDNLGKLVRDAFNAVLFEDDRFTFDAQFENKLEVGRGKGSTRIVPETYAEDPAEWDS